MRVYKTVTTFVIGLGLLLLISRCDQADGQETSIAESAKTTKKIIADLEWPQWRGPHRDGTLSGETKWPDSIGGDCLKEIWSKKLGPSYSGPVVSSQLVFTTETIDKQRESVRAFDRKTGDQKWETSWEGAVSVPFFAKSNGDWIRSTPAFDGENLYVAGMRDVLVCLNAHDGTEKWRVDFVKSLDAAVPAFGFVCSPLVDNEFVYVQAGGGVCKLKKSNGELVWRSLVDKGGMNGSAFSSPIIGEISGKRQLLVQTRQALAGVELDNGDVLWSQKIPTFRGMNILTPTVYQNSVFTSAYGGTSELFKIIDSTQVEKIWQNGASGYMSSPIVIGNYIYIHLRNQRFTCIDLESGKSKWTTKPYGKYWSMVVNGDRILALDESGELLLINASPEKFDLVESRKISEDSTWAHLAVAGDQIFIRQLNALSAYRWSDDEK